jgi:hypothetical protein
MTPNKGDVFVELTTMDVIRVVVERGAGTGENDLVRYVSQYYTADGEFLAEYDPCPNGKLPEVNPDLTPLK